MSFEEVHGKNESYSRWHRPSSIKRFLKMSDAAKLDMVDLDSIECDEFFRPIALIETCVDYGQQHKNHRALFNLARMANIPAFIVFCKLSNEKLPAHQDTNDIDHFRVQRINPRPMKEYYFTPQNYADWLLAMRKHRFIDLVPICRQQARI